MIRKLNRLYPSGTKRLYTNESNKKTRMLRLIDLFLKEVPQQIDRLAEIMQNGNMSDANYMAHEIKGVSANLGILRVAQVSDLLESAVQQQDQHLTMALLHSLTDELNRSTEVLRAFTAQHRELPGLC